MQEGQRPVRCSVCGAESPREDMFGAEPDLLCERCADRVRTRTAPSATGRLVNVLGSGRNPVILGVVGLAVILFVTGRLFGSNPASWAPWTAYLTMVGFTVEGQLIGTVIGQPWRLLTSAFLHAGVIHILFNLWWIWDLGRAIEWRRGSAVAGILVVGSAVAAGALQWMFGGPGVGLSGVVYALAGFLFALRRDDPLAAAVMNPRTTRFLLLWLVIGVVLSETGALPIGNWAHGGGAAWGVAAGFASRSRNRVLWLALLALATVGLVAWVMAGKVYW